MKNVHVLPTEKPSRLHYNEFEELVFTPKSEQLDGVNIYITSDEEISGFENNIWVIQGKRVYLWKNTMALVSNHKPKKIILTTNQELIKDGVQAIDDGFLEWFVKNPSCEEVEVVSKDFFYDKEYWHTRYKIVIPKEEPKQETLEEALSRFKEEHTVLNLYPSNILQNIAEFGAKWQATRLYDVEEVYSIVRMCLGMKESGKTDIEIGACLERYRKK